MIEKLCAQAFEAGAKKALSDFGLSDGTKTAGEAGAVRKFIRSMGDTFNSPLMSNEGHVDTARRLAGQVGDMFQELNPNYAENIPKRQALRQAIDDLHAMHGTPAAPPVVVPPPTPAPVHGLDHIRAMVRKNPLAIAGGLGAAGLGAGALGGYEANPDDSLLDHLKFWE